MISRKRLLVFVFPIIIGGIILFTVFYIFIKPKIPNKSRLQSITESQSNSALCIHTTVVGQETSEVIHWRIGEPFRINHV